MVGLDEHVVADASFPAVPESVAAARRLVAGAVGPQAAPETVDRVTLLTSELVTNAIVHAASTFEVMVTRPAAGLRVAVTDDDPRLPAVCATAGLGEGGRGLLLVEALADAWGVEPREVGKVVWFRLVE